MVRAGADGAGSINSDIWNFTTVLPAPTEPSPAKYAEGISKTVTLSWKAVQDAGQYRVFVAESASTLSNLSYTATECPACKNIGNPLTQYNSFQIPSGVLDGGKKYYWVVRAGTNDAGSINSEVWNFTTALDSLATPDPYYPIQAMTIYTPTPTFLWESVFGAEKYRLFVAEDSADVENLADDATYCQNCIEPNGGVSEVNAYTIPSGKLQPGKTYHWVVHAGAAGAGSPNSGVESFYIGLATPILTNPASNETIQTKTQTFSWGAIPGAEAYRLFIAESEAILTALANDATTCSGCVELNGGWTATNSYTIGSGKLKGKKTYYWSVHAGAAQASSQHSEVRPFTTGTITSIGPTSGTFNIGENITITWSYPFGGISTPMLISLKRGSCNNDGTDICQENSANWKVLTTTAPNTGSALLPIPTTLAIADDWHINVKDATDPAVWEQGAGQITLQQKTNSSDVAQCIGNNYEQQMPLAGVIKPKITAMNGPTSITEGEIKTFSANATVDGAKGGSAFYFWCADRGGFQKDPTSSNFSSVLYVAPSISQSSETEKITVIVGDGIGYVAKKTMVVTINGINNADVDNPAPTIQLAFIGNLTTGKTVNLGFTLTDTNASGGASTNALSTGIYYLLNGSEYTIVKGLKGNVSSYPWIPPKVGSGYQIKVVTTDGNSTVSKTGNPFDVSQLYVIKGYVTNTNGAPLSNATITISGAGTTLTDYAGYYEYSGLSFTTYMVTAAKSGYDFTPESPLITLTASLPVKQVNFTEWIDPDTDGDGIVDAIDLCPFTYDPNQADFDNDGVGDACDDFDGDGIVDADDVDNDNDGVLDLDDKFPFEPTESTDNDGDGTGDNGDEDDDNDGVADTEDAFPFDASESADTDGDGIGDNGDAFPNDANESTDTDGDGMGDNGDNCAAAANPDQADADSDDIGDACDGDDDNDGVIDMEDTFPLDTTESIDFDGDSIGDNADPDDDNDGVSDGEDLYPFDPTMWGNQPPTQDVPVLNQTPNLDLVVELQNLSDPENDFIIPVIDWVVNGESLMVLNMPFEKGESEYYTKDYSTYKNDGMFFGAEWQKNGGVDGFGAVSFDGMGDYIGIPHHPTLDVTDSGGKSFVAWIKPEKVSGYQAIFSKTDGNLQDDSGYVIGLTNDRLSLRYNDGEGGSHAIVGKLHYNENEWQHIAVVVDRDNGVVRLYRNGEEESAVAIESTGSWEKGVDMHIGNTISHYWLFDGLIDGAQIYNRAMTMEQIGLFYTGQTVLVDLDFPSGDAWQACVTPNNSWQDGEMKCSTEILFQ